MIKRVRIQNFRSLVDVTVDLDPLTVLIGRSGTGKSNFVHAIRFLRDSLNARSFDIQTAGGLARARHLDHPTEQLGFQSTFSIGGHSTEYCYLLRFNSKTSHYEESLRIGKTVLFHHAEGKWIVVPDVAPP